MRIKIKSKKLLSLLLCFTMLLGAGSVMASAETHVVDMKEGLKALTKTTTLPANMRGTIGDKDIFYTDPNGHNVYANLYKFEITESPSFLKVDTNYKNSNFHMCYWLFKENGETLEKVYYDSYGIGFVQLIEETGTYYLAAAGWKNNHSEINYTGNYGVEISAEKVTDEIYDLEEALLSVTETTALPAEFDYELGSENIRYYDGYDYAYGKLIKVEVEDDALFLKVNFNGYSKDTYTYVYVYKLENDGERDYLDKIDSNYYSVNSIVDSGTYYIALLGNDYYDEGNCHAKISAEKPVIKNMTDALAELTETTSLPAKFDYELGSENNLYIVPGDEMVYAKLIKFTVDNENTLLTSYFCGKYEYVDTCTALFMQYDEEIFSLNGTDDNAFEYKINQPGTYYLALAGYNSYAVGECMAEINTYSLDDVASLDFTDSENLPVPGEDDKWSWDEATKTLTLKDGFSFLGYTESSDAAITLPDGSTVFVDGKADINLVSNSLAIGSEGALTVKGSGAETSKLNFKAPLGNNLAILANDIIIEDVAVNTNNVSEGILANNSIIIRNAKIGLSDCYIGIETSPDFFKPSVGEIIIENSKIDITANHAAIAAFHGNITVTDSELNLETEGIGIDAEARIAEGEEATENAGKITISGGTLKIATEGCCLTETISLSDVDFDLRSNGESFYNFGSGVVYLVSEEGFAFPGVFTLYDLDGNELYNGEWSDEIQIIDGELYVGEEQVFSAVTFHPHVHELSLVPAKQPTATEGGNIQYYICGVCGKFFEDENGEKEITDKDSVIIPALDEPTTPDDPAEPDDEDEINCPFFRWLKAFILSCVKWIKEMPVFVFFWFKGIFEKLASVL